MSTALATVHFINTLSYSCSFLWNVYGALWQTEKAKTKAWEAVTNVRISTDIHWAGSAAAKKTCGLHRWEASIQQHKVIVLKSIVAWWSAYWQSPQLDSNGTEVRAHSLFLSLFPSLCLSLLHGGTVNPRSSLLFLWDFMNIPRQWMGLLISVVQLNPRQWQIIRAG